MNEQLLTKYQIELIKSKRIEKYYLQQELNKRQKLLDEQAKRIRKEAEEKARKEEEEKVRKEAEEWC